MSGAGVLILGCGYTGRRVAQRLLAAGVPVTATTRTPSNLADLAGAHVIAMDVLDAESVAALRRAAAPGVMVLHSVPPVRGPSGPFDPTPLLLEALEDKPSRMVYLSTTGVYGTAREVDEKTPAAPRSLRESLRLDAERAVADGPRSSLILRPGAIYGPWRGVHESMRRGKFQLIEGGQTCVSRIHVDDLAAHVIAALGADLTGAYPVADEEPCPSHQIAAFCAELLGLPMPPSVPRELVGETRRADRRVDGSPIRQRLGITLRYPSYRTGIPSALATEGLRE